MFVFTINIWNESDPLVQNSEDVYRRRWAWNGYIIEILHKQITRMLNVKIHVHSICLSFLGKK